MPAFFKPWRRKIGVLTLVMACVFLGGWVRSLSIEDKVTIPIPQAASVEFLSMQSKFCLTRYSRPQRCEWKSTPMKNVTNHPMNLLSADWSMRFCGLRLFTNLHAYGDKTAGLLVPYWMPVVPITLLSVFLLLSKSRESTRTQIVVPIPAGDA